MSTSAELLADLLAGGLNYADVGKALGRNRSYVRQVAIGAKPGHGLTESLAALRERLAAGGADAAKTAAVPAPEARVTRAGRPARVRRPTTTGPKSGAWATSTVKRQGARNGAHGLAHAMHDADEAGQTLAVTVTFAKSVTVLRAYGHRGQAGRGGSVEMELGEAGDVLDGLAAYDGNVTAYLIARMVERGDIASGVKTGQVEAVEMRRY